MCDSLNLSFAKKDLTEEIIEHILRLDSTGTFTLNELYEKNTDETWIEFFERSDAFEKMIHHNYNKDREISYSLTGTEETLTFYGESKWSDTEVISEFKGYNIPFLMWFESCDGYNPYEVIYKPNGNTITYDVDYDNSDSFVRASLIHSIRNYPAATFKAIITNELDKTRFNGAFPIFEPLDDVAPEHATASIVGRMDEGEITEEEAIKEMKALSSKEHQYMVLIHPEYVDGIGYINKPEGEFGGDGYVELPSSYPVCIGTYRGKSPEEAIGRAAGNMDCNEEVLYAVEISK